MYASRSWLSARIGRWLDRWASSLVMEAECEDGTRLLIGLDPSFHGALPVAVATETYGVTESYRVTQTGEIESAAAGRRPAPWPDGVVVPDDLRDLVP